MLIIKRNIGWSVKNMTYGDNKEDFVVIRGCRNCKYWENPCMVGRIDCEDWEVKE